MSEPSEADLRAEHRAKPQAPPMIISHGGRAMGGPEHPEGERCVLCDGGFWAQIAFWLRSARAPMKEGAPMKGLQEPEPKFKTFCGQNCSGQIIRLETGDLFMCGPCGITRALNPPPQADRAK